MSISTTSDELRKLDAGSWKGPEFTGERIPFLEEVLKTVPSGKQLFIEVKCGPEIIPHLQRVIRNSFKASRCVVIGFSFETMRQTKAAMPHIPVYWLSGTRRDSETREFIPHSSNWITNVKDAGLDGLNVHFAGIDKTFAEEVKASGTGFFAWTVNDADEAVRLNELGIHGITTDVPDVIQNVVK